MIVPILKETREVLEHGIESYARASFAAEKILVVLAIEERASDEVKRGAAELQEKHRHEFVDFLIVIHPAKPSG